MNPKSRRILAVDLGDRRTGLAATDYTGSIVVPLAALVGHSDEDLARELAAIAQDRETEVVVVGLPLDTRGAEGPRAQRTRRFVAHLQRATPCAVVLVDETATTDEAHERLARFGLKASQRKRLADSVAAMIILERYRNG